jgi:hypothetical protein
MVAPPRVSRAMALPPGWPLLSPSINRGCFVVSNWVASRCQTWFLNWVASRCQTGLLRGVKLGSLFSIGLGCFAVSNWVASRCQTWFFVFDRLYYYPAPGRMLECLRYWDRFSG